MKMTMYTAPTMVPRPQLKERRPGRPLSGKRLAPSKNFLEKGRSMIRRSLDPCDNSNDSGLGFDHHMDSMNNSERLHWTEDRLQVKRPKLDVKLENDDINDSYTFPEHTQMYRDNASLTRTAAVVPTSSLNVSNTTQGADRRAVPRCAPLVNSPPISLITQVQPASRYADVSLSIVCQPEQQHRARYQTEGSRGAVKDRSGNGFPVVQLTGYHKPAALQVFIGTDVGKVAPHMFYQACRVSGKNSTPCSEKKVDGTIVIELQLDPGKEMVATCDCVGILKERNVDVEHRFPDQLGSRSKKKSTRCRMIFRTTIVHDDGIQETLQICSQPIVCTQPPGVPEISKKSLTGCPANGGLELFIIGKNFLKDTVVYFRHNEDHHITWEKCVVPDKEYLQQTHLVCVVPPYINTDIVEPVTVRMYVVSSGKTSEAHQFVYTPTKGVTDSVRIEQQQPQAQTAPFLAKLLWTTMTKQEQDIGMMPPPDTSLVPLSQRRPSINMSGEPDSPPMRTLKQELVDENSQNSVMDPTELQQSRYRHISESSLDVQQGDSNISMINDNSIDLINHGQIMHSNITDNANLEMVSELVEAAGRDGMIGQNSLGELSVVDLTMKLPMASVADLVDTKAPSMATLQSFGVTESNNLALPSQTAQSIENYLTNIEVKAQSTLLRVAEHSMSAYAASSRPSTNNATPETIKCEASVMSNDNMLLSQVQVNHGILPNPITTEKLDALVNCAVDTHIKDTAILLGTRDVLLGTPLAAIINVPPQMNQPVPTGSQRSPAMSPEIILNSQISQLCRSGTQDGRLPPDNLVDMCNGSIGVSDPENAILLNAAADLLETQKKINDLHSDLLTTSNGSVQSLGQLPNGNGFFSSADLLGDKQEYAATAKLQADKKKEDRMITSSFATMSENDLINIINPSCFDQV